MLCGYNINRPVLTYGRVLALLFAASVTVGIALMPRIADDLCFALPFRDFDTDGWNWTWPEIQAEILHRFNTENARLSNIIALGMVMWPRWALGVICGIVLLWLTLLGMKMADIASNRPWPWTLWIAYLTLLLPWHEVLYTFVFQCNYIWSAALMLLLVRLLQKQSSTWKIFAAGLLLGLWHEGFAVPAGVGVLAWMVFLGPWRDARLWAAGIGLLLGLIWMMSWPGF